jgi:hypothetical protein
MYITGQNNKIHKNMTEQEQIFFEQERLWALFPLISSTIKDDTDLVVYFELIKRINAFHLSLVKLQREKLLLPPKF